MKLTKYLPKQSLTLRLSLATLLQCTLAAGIMNEHFYKLKIIRSLSSVYGHKMML